jgi:hypothetical protein
MTFAEHLYKYFLVDGNGLRVQGDRERGDRKEWMDIEVRIFLRSLPSRGGPIQTDASLSIPRRGYISRCKRAEDSDRM